MAGRTCAGRDLTGPMVRVLAAVHAAGGCRIVKREIQWRTDARGRFRVSRNPISSDPQDYRAECAGRALPIRTVAALLSRGDLVPLRRGWNVVVRLKVKRPPPYADPSPIAYALREATARLGFSVAPEEAPF